MKGRYDLGERYCSHCRAWFRINDTRCPVCNRLLRYRPRKKPDSVRSSLSRVDPEKYGVMLNVEVS